MYLRSMPTLKAGINIVALILLAVTGCSCASPKQEVTYTILDNTPQGALRNVGTVGVVGYDVNAAYKLVMHPTMDAEGKVFVPGNTETATTELQKSLPASYLKELKTVSFKDRYGNNVSVCKSKDDEMDNLVRSWLIVYWDLSNPSGEFQRLSANRVNSTASPIAESVLLHLCVRLKR